MTDCRLPERWLNDRRLQRLSPDHFRSFVNALLYAVANRTDGVIDPSDLGLIPHWAAGAAQALIDAELFTPLARGWLLADYESTQSSRSELETLERIRAADRRRKAEKRATPKLGQSGCPPDGPAEVPPDVPGDGPADVSSGPVHRTSQAGRTGRQEGLEEGNATNVLPMKTVAKQQVWRGAGPSPFEEYK